MLMPANDDDAPPAELSLAGSVVDKAIEYMSGQNVPPVAIASALLGGAMALLARTVSDDVIVQVLTNAITSVRAGELRG
jgi:amino acid permease